MTSLFLVYLYAPALEDNAEDTVSNAPQQKPDVY